ncbi:OstA-like protein [Dysgonomonas reticulitermitis]
MFNKLITYIKQRHRLPAVSILCLIVIYASAQTMLSPNPDAGIRQVPQKPQSQQKPQQQPKKNAKVIEIKFAKQLLLRDSMPNIQILKDSVIFLHDGAYLYCDSAYYNQVANTFDAFSNVRMEQGDTIFLYGNFMYYDGNTKLVRFRKNVSLEHYPKKNKTNVTTLLTDSLNYDRIMNIGYYFDGGMLIDSLNELTSYWGQYEPGLHMATFKDSVILKNPKFMLYSDLLKYDTAGKLALISTPTKIVSDSGLIYTSKGWYNTNTEESLLLDQSTVLNKEGNRILRGDSIFYHKAKGYGEVFGNMFLQDTLKKVILMGDYGYYNELTDYAMATDSAFCIEYSQPDSLFIHGDTLKLITITDTVKQIQRNIVHKPVDSLLTDSAHYQVNDSLHVDHALVKPVLAAGDSVSENRQKTDSIQTFRMIKAYYGVRFYRTDIQGICDSLQFSARDSIIHMYKDPVLWNTDRQLSGDTIDVFMNDSTIDYMHVKRYAFSIEQKDSVHFNQMKSRSLKIYFENKKTREVLAEGNVETISYPEERNGELSRLLNRLEVSYLKITFVDGKFNRMVGWSENVSKMTPFDLVKPDQLRLKDFYWFDYLRPLDKKDIFRKVKRKSEDVVTRQRSSVFNRIEE